MEPVPDQRLRQRGLFAAEQLNRRYDLRWACDEEAAQLRDAYIHEPDDTRRKPLLDQLSRWLWQVLPTVILGQRAQLYAWRNNLSGFVRSPSLVPVFWGIEKK